MNGLTKIIILGLIVIIFSGVFSYLYEPELFHKYPVFKSENFDKEKGVSK